MYFLNSENKEIKALISCVVTMQIRSAPLFWHLQNQSRTNGPINAHLTIAQVMPRYNHNNEKQEALL